MLWGSSAWGTTPFQSDINKSICSHFLGTGLVPEQRQQVSPVFFLTAESQKRLGVETGLDSTWATCWLKMYHNVCVPKKHRGAWWSTFLREERPLEPSQPPHRCLSTPVSTWLNPGRRWRALRRTRVWVRGKVWHRVCLSLPCAGRWWELCSFELRTANCYKQKLPLCQPIWHKVWHARAHWNNGRCKTSWLVSHCLWATVPLPWAPRGLKGPWGAVKR